MESEHQVKEADAKNGERDVYDGSECASPEANLKCRIVIIS